jgi:hypothetical protein
VHGHPRARHLGGHRGELPARRHDGHPPRGALRHGRGHHGDARHGRLHPRHGHLRPHHRQRRRHRRDVPAARGDPQEDGSPGRRGQHGPSPRGTPSAAPRWPRSSSSPPTWTR